MDMYFVGGKEMKVREDTNAIKNIKSLIFNIVNELENVEINKATEFANWILSKSQYINKLSNGKFIKIPKNIKRGDIVRIEFGINIGEELSDENRDGHFAIIWVQQGFTFMAIPLTTAVQTNNPYAVNLGKINGLPQSTDSYAKIDYLRWIDKNRIKFMHQHKNGKIVIEDEEKLDEALNKIKNKMKEMFIDS